jgi:hypothetical protein
MSWLFLVNTVVFAGLYLIWNKSDLLNFSLKAIMFGLLVLNGIQCYKAFEVDRVEAAKSVPK